MRLQMARADHASTEEDDSWSDDAQNAETEIKKVLQSLSWAMDDLPKEQRRQRVNPEAVRHVHDALLKGWAAAHAGNPMPPFPFKPSRHPSSDFRRIVGICFAAVTGNEGADPERAIKAFIRQEREAARRRHSQRAR
jgi:hypothetical protein